MLINLSNHPSIKWPENQLKAAIKEFNEIVDLSFPAINPAIDENELLALANNYAEKCLQQFNSATNQHLKNAVHIMGELTFCFALVSLLQKKGIRCIASTTKRIAIQNGLTKTSGFEFVRFREYPKLKYL